MNLVLTVLEIVAPVILLAGVGAGWVRLGWEYPIEFVTRIGMTLAVPCLVFSALVSSDASPGTLATLSLAAFACYGVIAALSLLFVRFARLDRRSYLAPITFGNTGNLGIPLALFAFGTEGLDYAVVILAVTSICMFTIGLWMVSGSGSPGQMVREPMFIASVLGGIFLWQGWQTPDWLTRSISLIGQMAIPLMLITLGVAVSQLRASMIGRSVMLSLVKVAICAIAAVATGRLFGLGEVAFAVLVLQMITPVAVTSYLIAERFGAESRAVAGLVFASTLLSVAALPIALAFLL